MKNFIKNLKSTVTKVYSKVRGYIYSIYVSAMEWFDSAPEPTEQELLDELTALGQELGLCFSAERSEATNTEVSAANPLITPDVSTYMGDTWGI